KEEGGSQSGGPQEMEVIIRTWGVSTSVENSSLGFPPMQSWQNRRGHFIIVCPSEMHLRGHFITFCPQERHHGALYCAVSTERSPLRSRSYFSLVRVFPQLVWDSEGRAFHIL
uniref:Uncharacterized protein n=1 Tax=Mola mola TaxID=94237 RepID=A0A3Q3WGC2_MOLML